MRLLLRTTALLLALAPALPVYATPIKPDLKKLLSQPQPKKPDYVPARAGWDGPEQRTPDTNLYAQRYAPEASARVMRANLFAALVPDWRIVLGLMGLIFLLRQLRKTSPGEAAASHQQPPANIPRAA